MKRKIKVKKQHWGWIAAGVVVVLLYSPLVPLDIFIRIAYEGIQKAKITKDLLVELTVTAKAMLSSIVVGAALIFYKVMK